MTESVDFQTGAGYVQQRADDALSFWAGQGVRGVRSPRVLAVINPTAGDASARQAPLVARLEFNLLAYGVHLERLVFDPLTLAAAIRDRRGPDLVAVYVFGGDGTMLAVVEAIDGCPLPVAIVPCGTVNWLARDLGIPPDPGQALQALLEPRLRLIDVGRVNGKPFLCACMVGMAPLLARSRERERHQPRWRRWPALLFTALKLWGRYPYLRLMLVADGRHRQLRSRTLVVVNNRIERTLGMVPDRPCLDAGVLELHAMRHLTIGRLRVVLERLVTGGWDMNDVMLTQAGTAMRVEVAGVDSLPVLLDGEIRRLRSPLHFRLDARMLPVLVPSAGS